MPPRSGDERVHSLALPKGRDASRQTEQRRSDRHIGLRRREQLLYDILDAWPRSGGNHRRLMSIASYDGSPFDHDCSAKDTMVPNRSRGFHFDGHESAAGQLPLERAMLRIVEHWFQSFAK